MAQSANIASYLAAQIVSVAGVQLESLDFNKIHAFIADHIVK